MTLDGHPLRRSELTARIERVLIRRSADNRVAGYTLEAALEIAEMAIGIAQKYGHHTSGCRWHGGHDCDCGWEEIKQ